MSGSEPHRRLGVFSVRADRHKAADALRASTVEDVFHVLRKRFIGEMTVGVKHSSGRKKKPAAARFATAGGAAGSGAGLGCQTAAFAVAGRLTFFVSRGQRFSISSKAGAATKIDEYVPRMIPTIMINAKSRMTTPPNR